MTTDRLLPARRDASNRTFYTARGFLTRYALACGYVEIRGDDESSVRLEQVSSNGTLRVVGSGRWIRGEGTTHHISLAVARRAFMAYDHAGLSARIKAAHMAEMDS